jgi:hypothetical protein
MGTNRSRNSSVAGTNQVRNGVRIGRIWNNANDTWDDVAETWDNYGSGDCVIITEGVNRTRNSISAGTNRPRN